MRLRFRWLRVALLAAPLASGGVVRAQAPAPEAPSAGVTPVPEVTPPSGHPDLEGRRIVRVRVVIESQRWPEAVAAPRALAVGQPFTASGARQALLELLEGGAVAEGRVEVEEAPGGVELRFHVVPRRLVQHVRVSGRVLDDNAVEAALGIVADGEVTERSLTEAAERLRALHARLGYPRARVAVSALATDDPARVVVAVELEPGPPRTVQQRVFRVTRRSPELSALLRDYPLRPGDVADEAALTEADHALERLLRAGGWHDASVGHRMERAAGRDRLIVRVREGVHTAVSVEGQRTFDATELVDALELESTEDRSPPALAERLRAFHVRRGFLDAAVDPELVPLGPGRRELRLRVAEGAPVRVVERHFPCLTGERSATEVGDEVDSFLSELPGAGLFGAVDPGELDGILGPHGNTGARPAPFESDPWSVYDAETYERAATHLQALYRSEGWLGAVVGPVRLLRQACDPRSPAGACRPLAAPRPPYACGYDAAGMPLADEPGPPVRTCIPDPARGVRCSAAAVVELPVRLGPRTLLYDVAFEGQQAFVEGDLLRLAELSLGEPVNQTELDRARRAILTHYADAGFAFAEVETELTLSADRTRAKVTFVVSERERVRVAGFVVRGARLTREGLILERVALERGGWYDQRLARLTEERLATLGVFGSVSVSLEDPYVPAREKVVVIEVQERLPQYLDVRPGFSTGEGFRVAFEYGHRNLGGEAIPLTVRVQLAYLPPPFIIESDVRRKYQELDVGSRLERRNSVLLEVPGLLLGPLFRVSIEGIDVRDNARDFGLVKDAGILTFAFRPDRTLSAQLGGSLERNTAEIFGNREKDALSDYVAQNPGRAGAFRVPSGTTVAVAERIGVTWDDRDSPFAATRGTLLSAGVEHVRADPVGETRAPVTAGEVDVFAPTTSQFLRLTGRVAGYVRLSQRGLALAASLRGGYNHQLLTPCRELAITEQALGNCSQTYPDRLFFLGGVDSLRGFPQDALVPEDVAARLLDPAARLSVEQVVVRGGDLFVNPRLELRIPMSESLQTALFLDSGNLWVDPGEVDPLDLRYAFGTGLRVVTPVGPLVFDYGFNLSRVLDGLDPGRAQQRFWEDLGAFHFSIGLF